MKCGPIGELIQEALQGRPEIASARINLTNLEISRKSIKNALYCRRWTLTHFTGASGLGGPQNPLIPTCPQNIEGECYQPGLLPTTYNGAFTNLFNSTAPDKGVGVNLIFLSATVPAQANQVRSDLEYRQAQGGASANREHDYAAGQAGAVRHAAELRCAAGGDRGSRLCTRKPDGRTEEVYLRRFNAHAGVASFQQPDHGRIERAECGGQLREVEGQP